MVDRDSVRRLGNRSQYRPRERMVRTQAGGQVECIHATTHPLTRTVLTPIAIDREQRTTTRTPSAEQRSTNHEPPTRTTNNEQRTTIENHHDNPFPEPVEIEIADSLDLHAFSPKDVKAVTIAYLEAARAKGFTMVRIIHGKGIGVQREIVRSVLSETEFVKGFKSGDGFGGEGSTVATFVE